MFMLRRAILRNFSSQKYFLDDKYLNISIESTDKLGSLNSISSKFAEHNVNMVYIKSQFANAWTKNKKYCLDVTIEKQDEDKLNLLKTELEDIGKSFSVQEPIKVPWFPKTVSDLDHIGKVLLNVKD